MGLGIKHSTSKTSRSQEDSSSNAHNYGGPNRQQSFNNNLTLLCSVGEIVVSGAHVIESSSEVHSDESTIKIGRSSIELHAISGILLNIVLVVGVLCGQICVAEATSLSKLAHPKSELPSLKKRSVRGDPTISCW